MQTSPPPAARNRAQSAPPAIRPKVAIPIIAALIAWAAVASNFVYLTWFSAAAAGIEIPLGEDNARIDIRSWQKKMPADQFRVYAANGFTINRGKLTAVGLQHLGIVAIGGSIDNALIDAMFASYRAQLRAIPRIESLEIRPGQDDVWFTVFGPVESNGTTKAINAGGNFFVFNLLRYSDKLLSSKEYIYTETCIYFSGEVEHFCEAGHNKSYISN